MLYQAAFTVIARRHGDARRGAMTILTLAGSMLALAAALFSVTLAITSGLAVVLLALMGLVPGPIGGYSTMALVMAGFALTALVAARFS